MMPDQRQDRRILKTKKAVRNALVTLLSEKNKSLGDISVSELCREADINRKTFYTYYYSVFDVVSEIETRLVDAFKQDIEEFDFEKNIHNPGVVFTRLTEEIESDKEFYSAIIRLDSRLGLFPKITTLLKAKVTKYYCSQKKMDPVIVGRISDFVIAGTIAVYRGWYDSDRTDSIDLLASEVSSMISGAISSCLEAAKKVVL